MRALALPLHVERALMANLAVLRTLRGEIPSLEAILHQKVKLRSEFPVLKTTPGIGDSLAATIMLETGSITRFPGVGHFSYYCRCVESERICNGKKKGEGNATPPPCSHDLPFATDCAAATWRAENAVSCWGLPPGHVVKLRARHRQWSIVPPVCPILARLGGLTPTAGTVAARGMIFASGTVHALADRR